MEHTTPFTVVVVDDMIPNGWLNICFAFSCAPTVNNNSMLTNALAAGKFSKELALLLLCLRLPKVWGEITYNLGLCFLHVVFIFERFWEWHDRQIS